MWEEFRKQKCPNRAEILQNILTIIKGRVKEVRDRLSLFVSSIKSQLVNSWEYTVSSITNTINEQVLILYDLGIVSACLLFSPLLSFSKSS